MAGDARDSPPSSEADADEAVRSVLEQRGLEQTLEKLGFGESALCFRGDHPDSGLRAGVQAYKRTSLRTRAKPLMRCAQAKRDRSWNPMIRRALDITSSSHPDPAQLSMDRISVNQISTSQATKSSGLANVQERTSGGCSRCAGAGGCRTRVRWRASLSSSPVSACTSGSGARRPVCSVPV